MGDGRVIHTGSVVDERQGCVDGLLLLLAGVAPAVRGVGQGRYQGAAGPAPSRSEGQVVTGLNDSTCAGIGDCPYAAEMVRDVMIDRVTRYRSRGVLVRHYPSSCGEYAVKRQGTVRGLLVNDITKENTLIFIYIDMCKCTSTLFSRTAVD